MSNESKPQEWFYLQDETWNGPFKTSGLKELVKKGLVDPSTLLRIGIAGLPINAHQVKTLFPNYQGVEQTTASSSTNGNNSLAYKLGTGIRKTRGLGSAIAVLLVFVLGLLIYSLFKSNGNVTRISLADGIASIEKTMIMVPSGKFMMGGRGDRLQVTLTKPFYMSKYEVTQEQWEAVMGNNPSSTKGAKLPVTNVSWEDCQEFIKKLNASTKGGYRLPYDAEWEYACRAGTTTAYSYGDNLTKSDANIDGDSIKAVGSYRPNAFGVYDMHGNVWEWCEDWYGSLQNDEVTDPKGAAKGEDRVMRGGSFFFRVSLARSSNRNYITPTFRSNYGGFRLARTK